MHIPEEKRDPTRPLITPAHLMADEVNKAMTVGKADRATTEDAKQIGNMIGGFTAKVVSAPPPLGSIVRRITSWIVEHTATRVPQGYLVAFAIVVAMLSPTVFFFVELPKLRSAFDWLTEVFR